jgi:hypothetical protein
MRSIFHGFNCKLFCFKILFFSDLLNLLLVQFVLHNLLILLLLFNLFVFSSLNSFLFPHSDFKYELNKLCKFDKKAVNKEIKSYISFEIKAWTPMPLRTCYKREFWTTQCMYIYWFNKKANLSNIRPQYFFGPTFFQNLMLMLLYRTSWDFLCTIIILTLDLNYVKSKKKNKESHKKGGTYISRCSIRRTFVQFNFPIVLL